MNVNFYFNNQSFVNNGEDLEYIYNRIYELDQLSVKISEINKRKKTLDLPKDIIFKDFDIYEQIFYDNKPLSDFIYTNKNIKKDYKDLLRILIDKSSNKKDENIDCEICFFKRFYCFIFNENNLIEFYHHHFQNLENGTDYFNGIKIHFENISLHDNVENSLNDIQEDLTNFSNDIVKTLIYLNDKIRDSLKKHNDVRATLEELTSEIRLHASVEGKGKGKLNFNFTKTNGESKELCCEPHVKYNRSEASGIEKEYYRMYFHTGDSEIEDGKVLIAHIGKHL